MVRWNFKANNETSFLQFYGELLKCEEQHGIKHRGAYFKI